MISNADPKIAPQRNVLRITNAFVVQMMIVLMTSLVMEPRVVWIVSKTMIAPNRAILSVWVAPVCNVLPVNQEVVFPTTTNKLV